MFLSYYITYKAISSPLVAAVAYAAAVVVAAASVVGGGGGGCGGAGGGGGEDLMLFRYFISFTLYFHYSLEIIFRNLINSFLTSDISLPATI